MDSFSFVLFVCLFFCLFLFFFVFCFFCLFVFCCFFFCCFFLGGGRGCAGGGPSYIPLTLQKLSGHVAFASSFRLSQFIF